ncbi:hypothetical protein ACFYO2_46540 [Streptomyces sp. NPDC006602]|uniref:hypothetical protein n=1 Tax=Streptomyces sp. NPDC006602 TaxID=3364751 RepID=UPI00368AC87E
MVFAAHGLSVAGAPAQAGMRPYLADWFGNPSRDHACAEEQKEAFLGGGTEAILTAVRDALREWP